MCRSLTQTPCSRPRPVLTVGYHRASGGAFFDPLIQRREVSSAAGHPTDAGLTDVDNWFRELLSTRDAAIEGLVVGLEYSKALEDDHSLLTNNLPPLSLCVHPLLC